MQGLSPRLYSLTARQIETSKQISDALPDLPITLSDLISEMAAPDYSLASQALELDTEGEVIQNPQNLNIIAHIELALTATSSECDPVIKSAIFQNANEPVYFGSTFGRVRPYLINIFHELKSRNQQINLDDVVVKDTILFSSKGINLGGMSARRARFENINMDSLDLSNADFTDAVFVDVSLRDANLSHVHIIDASFFHVYFGDTLANGLTGNQSAIFSAVRSDSSAHSLEQLPAGDSVFRFARFVPGGSGVTAVPDRTAFTIPKKSEKS